MELITDKGIFYVEDLVVGQVFYVNPPRSHTPVSKKIRYMKTDSGFVGLTGIEAGITYENRDTIGSPVVVVNAKLLEEQN